MYTYLRLLIRLYAQMSYNPADLKLGEYQTLVLPSSEIISGAHTPSGIFYQLYQQDNTTLISEGAFKSQPLCSTAKQESVSDAKVIQAQLQLMAEVVTQVDICMTD